MIPLIFLYDEYIDRPKLSEQKKTHLSIIVPPPTSGIGTIMTNLVCVVCLDKLIVDREEKIEQFNHTHGLRLVDVAGKVDDVGKQYGHTLVNL